MGPLPRPDPAAGVAFERTDHAFGVDLVAVRLDHHEFPRHVHEGYTIGVVEVGGFEFWCRGATRVCPPGSFVLINPGEVHTGRARGRGSVGYRVLYPTAGLIESLLGRAPPMAVRESSDPRLVREFARLDRTAGPAADRFVAESTFVDVMDRLFLAFAPGGKPPAGRGRDVVARVREVLLDDLRAPPSLAELGRTLGLHPAYVTRVFRAATGLPPHAYLAQLRVMRARQLLAKGAPIAATAFAAGFADQSHLTRQFKRVMGYSPGRFQRQLGYRAPSAGPGSSGSRREVTSRQA